MRFLHKLATIALSFLVVSCSSQSSGEGDGGYDGWQRIDISESGASFQLPKPVEESQPEDGSHQFSAKKEDVTFKVYYLPRDSRSDHEKGYQDDYVLKVFAAGNMVPIEDTLKKQGYNPEVVFDGALEASGGLGTQYTVTVGKRVIVNRFYVTDNNFLYVEVGMNNPDSDIARMFMDSIKI